MWRAPALNGSKKTGGTPRSQANTSVKVSKLGTTAQSKDVEKQLKQLPEAVVEPGIIVHAGRDWAHPGEPPILVYLFGKQFQSSLCDCFEEGPAVPSRACLDAFCCPYCQLAHQESMMLQRNPTPSVSAWLTPCFLDFTCCFGCCLMKRSYASRSTVMERYRIDPESDKTCLTAYCCPCCSVLQVFKELTKRREFPGAICADDPYLDDDGLPLPPSRMPPPPLPEGIFMPTEQPNTSHHTSRLPSARRSEKSPLPPGGLELGTRTGIDDDSPLGSPTQPTFIPQSPPRVDLHGSNDDHHVNSHDISGGLPFIITQRVIDAHQTQYTTPPDDWEEG